MFAQIAIPNTPFYQLFDYFVPESILPHSLYAGMRVIVEFGKTKKIAFLIDLNEKSDFPAEKIKPLLNVLDKIPLLTAHDLHFLKWISDYYHYPLGDVIASAFPVLLRQGKSTESHFNAIQKSPFITNKTQSFFLNTEQQNAVNQIVKKLNQFNVFLLEGVTGSGKTEIYLQLIEHVLKKNQQILVLVPEITLTPQLEQRFQQRFNNINLIIYHSKLTNIKRKESWLAMQSGWGSILLGTRSALLTPFQDLGLIILDEEHDSSFKQQEGLRFSARDMAIVRAKLFDIPIILGSATPSLESLHNAHQKRYQHLYLPKRAGGSLLPEMYLIDIRNQRLQGGLSRKLVDMMHATLNQKQQILIFLNRRGFAPTIICHQCGWVARCEKCESNLVFHHAKSILLCHHCGKVNDLIYCCNACESTELKPLGRGTEQVEHVLNSLFPNKKILRLDSDSIRKKNALENYLTQINQGEADIILGTQLLAKGHHFANVTLVAILDVDSGLFSVDFHAAEKLAQLIVQVSGRAGREEKRGIVVLQTRQPQNPLLNTLINENYRAFAAMALAERQQAQLPPFTYQALLRANGNNEQTLCDFLNYLTETAQSAFPDLLILGAVPALMARKAGRFYYQILFQHDKRKLLHQALTWLMKQLNLSKTNLRWSIDVDPIDF